VVRRISDSTYNDMYGFSGYGTNAYGSERRSFSAPFVKMAMVVIRNTYGMGVALMLKFKALTLEL